MIAKNPAQTPAATIPLKSSAPCTPVIYKQKYTIQQINDLYFRERGLFSMLRISPQGTLCFMRSRKWLSLRNT